MNTLTFSRDALRELDRRAVEEFHIPILVLMENAGRAVAETTLRHLHKNPRRALVLAGQGNNGGDGLVAARHLHNAGIVVSILLLAERDYYRDAAATQLAIVDAMNMHAESLSSDHAELRDWLVDSNTGDVLIDGLFGTGLSRTVEGLAADVIRAANASRRTIIAIDIPSGLDAETGQPLGVAIRAAETVSFCGLKRGFAQAQGYTGKVTVADIGAPRELLLQLAAK
ncbi:MAG TPA: NAD(P)H-hydrate epimerase [Phycisphaerae bacterium]|nr:NAD(P)H-hydrate epimerase [Phycisphaerae bacterium]